MVLKKESRAVGSGRPKRTRIMLLPPNTKFKRNRLPPAEQLKRRVGPLEVLQIDFTEIVKCVSGCGEE